MEMPECMKRFVTKLFIPSPRAVPLPYVRTLIEALQINGRFGIREDRDAWEVTVRKPEGFNVEIIVPKDVLEWSVTVTDAHGHHLWTDWNEHYALARETRDQLAAEMARDIQAFIDRVVARSFRTEVTECGTDVEWLIEGSWREILLYDEA